LQLYLDYNVQPDFSNYLDTAGLTNCSAGTYPTGLNPGNDISYGPPLRPGTYYVGLFNPSFQTANAYLIATLGGLASPILPSPTTTNNGPALLDDAASTSTLFIAATQQIASVNVGFVVNHPRISDLTFTLLSPTGQRVLLMENRGGSTTNGAGDDFVVTNNFAPVTANGGGLPQTNVLNLGQTSGSLLITYNMFTVPDQMTVYYGTNSVDFVTNGPFCLFNSGSVSGTGTTNIIFGPGTSTFLTVIMNQFGNPAGANGTAWTYTAGGIETNYNYLMFTEDTNLTTVPIKFAVPPFVFTASGTNYDLSDFDLATNGDYIAPTNIYDAHGGWNLTNRTTMLVGTNLVTLTNNYNEVSVVSDPAIAAGGSNYLALAYGSIFRQIPMTPGRQFSLSFQYRGPGISAWYRAEGDANDSSDPENNGNNGMLIGRFNFPVGEVGQAFQMQDAGSEFQFAGTNTYVQIRQAPVPKLMSGATETNASTIIFTSPLDVGTGSGLTIEGWINPTNISFQQPLVEWLARTPTNTAVTNLMILAGPFLNPATSHFYYLLGSTNWTVSEFWAQQLGGHLVTIDTANEQNWVYDTFASYGGTNRNLWIGLTNNYPANPTNYVWSSGTTNLSYFNWQTNQPNFCAGNEFYTAMLGSTNAQPGLWVVTDNNGLSCTFPPANKMFGVVEVDDIQPNGVQFWISVTNVPGTTNFVTATNGCLFANLVDTTNGSHLIYSAPGLVVTNVFQHVALTYNTNSGLAVLYYNGTNVASTNLGYFLPKTTGDVLLGKDMSRMTNNFYGGKMDEMSIYNRSLSGAEIAAIYDVSFLTTNRNIGKFDPTITPALGLAEAQVSFGNLTNVLLGANNTWQSQNFSFTVTSNSLPLQITGLEPGMLLDSFNISEVPLGNLYYLPEQPLDSLKGQSAFGTWTLQILDDRTGAYITNSNQLVSWQLQFVLQTNTLPEVVLGDEENTTISVPPGEIVVLPVSVPTWANFATNVLVSSTLPVDLLFNQTNPPTGSPVDYVLLTGSTGGSSAPLIAAPPSVPPLLPGQTYYLGVRNPNAHAATVVVRVDYDITALTNGVPLTSVLTTNVTDVERYFVFNVTSNAYEATFQLLNLSSNADLVVRKGALPTLDSSDYGSFNVTNADENIFVLTNSSPVPLSAGQWYLGVFRRDAGPVRYTVLAKELDTPQPTVIDLTNNVPFTFTAGPGAALTNFFRFTVTNFPPSIHFELYNLTGNGDLTVQTNALPLAPPFFQSSQQPGVTPEFISILTNSAQTNLSTTALTNLNVQWYLGVPNHEIRQITYTILASLDTNSVFPAFPGAEGAGAGSVGGRYGLTNTVYHVVNLNDSGVGSLRDAVTVTNRTIVFDVSGTINLQSPLIITNSYLTIAGQTAPGGGITVAGWETRVANAHDLIIRDVRFRRGAIDDSLMFTNVANVIADHVSAEWADTVMSTLNSSNVTMQWSILANSLKVTNDPPPSASLLRYGSGALSFHHNLYANNYSGSPRLGDNLSLDFVNNVIYGWGTNASFTLDDSTNNPAGFTNYLNYVCNYLIADTNSLLPAIAFRGGTTNTWIYQTNNFIDSNTNGILDGANTSWAMFTNQFTKVGQSFPLPPVSTDEAFKAYERVLDFAGLSQPARDVVDTNVITGVRNQTGTIISAPPLSGMVAWWKAEGNGLDSVGGNNGAPTGGITYTNGEVGQAFVFNGATTSYVPVAATPSLNGIGASGSGFTIECWVKPASTAGGPIIEWDSATVDGLQFWIQGGSQLYANIQDTSGTSHSFFTGLGVLNSTNFQHVALTYDKRSGNACIYRNGVIVASANFGNITPQTTYPNLRIGLRSATSIGTYAYTGLIDELSVYKRALSASEIASIYNAGSAGKSSATVATLPPFRDSDQDGIPDFWETTFGQFPTNASNFLPSTYAPGYTDLEEYLNWLGAPHALTITNTPVSVDLQQLFGNTGNLTFEVTNSVNGLVYLTNVLSYTNALGVGINVTNTGPFSNSIAVFTPTSNVPSGTNYFGYAAFDVTVTNNDTVAYFGPVTVSVVVSSVPITYASNNTNTPPMFTNTIPTNQVINELTLLTVTNTATSANTNLTLSYVVTMSIDTNAMNAMIPPWPLNFATTNPSPVIDANGIITWTPTELQGPGVYIITTVVTDSSFPPLSATNSFSVTVNEVNMAPFWPTNVPSQTNYNISALATLVVTNTATDADIPTNPLTYALSGPIGASIDTNGIITWTPTISQVGSFTFTTIVTDTNVFALVNKSLSATNVFTVFVSPVVLPFAFTQPAQSITGTSAQLNGMATPNGLPTIAWFEWGTTTNYGNVTLAVNIGNSYNVVYTTNQISGLLTNVPYHFRLVVSNIFAVVHGFDQILDEANVIVWGADYVGQANVPPGLTNAVAIAGAYDHSLALKNNGTVAAWGDNTFGQSTVPPGLNGLVAVAGGEYYSMALKNNGTVVAWGATILGQTNIPSGLNNVVTIAGGTYCSLALKNNGTVVAWGAPFFALTNVPAGASNTVAVAGGGFHNLAIKNDGTVIAWGDDSAGQTNLPASLTNVVAIAAGNYHSLALRNDGTVVAWGDDSAGQTNVPAGLNNVVAIAAGGFHSLALKSDGTVVTWGDNSAGQSSVPLGLTNVVAISSGYFHSMALTPQSLASLTNPIVLNLTNGLPQTNTILAGGLAYYRVHVPTNADFATNSLLFAYNGPLNIWFTTNTPPTIGGANDSLLLAGVTNGISILSTTSAPPNIVPGGIYYLGVNNTNNFAVTYGIEVDFHLVNSTNIPPLTNTIPFSIVYTNIGGTNGYLLTWFAPSNDLFQVQWAGSLPPTWTTFTNIISYNPNVFTSPTNTQFNFFDNGSQTGGTLGTIRFYQLILLGTVLPPTNTPPILPAQTNQVINPLVTLTVTNTATDAQSPPQILTYTLLSTVTGTNIPAINAASGVITWTPTAAQAGTSNTITTIVTDNGTPNLSATNSFSVIVNPIPPISSVVYTNGGILLTWFAPSNDLFQVQFTDSLASTNWTTFTNIVSYNPAFPDSSTNAQFNFFDDGLQYPFTGLRFYRLQLIGLALPNPPPLTNTIPISNVIYTNGNLLLTWWAPTNDIFQVQVATSLASPIIWLNFSNLVTYTGPVTPTNGLFSFLDNGSQYPLTSPHFYQLKLIGITSPLPPATNLVSIGSIIFTNGNFRLTWLAPTNDQFNVGWATNIIPPITWNLFPGTITSTNGTFTFMDTNGLMLMKCYELILLP
jgi:subtilisin-like proprotein convertase family protein